MMYNVNLIWECVFPQLLMDDNFSLTSMCEYVFTLGFVYSYDWYLAFQVFLLFRSNYFNLVWQN